MEMSARDPYPAGVPRTINYPEIPLYFFLENSARKYPNRDAIIFYGKRLNYSRVWDETRRLALSLGELGVGRGDRVGLLLPNVPQFVIGYYATLFLGGTVVSVNPLNSPEEIERELKETGVKVLIALDRFLDLVQGDSETRIIVAEPESYLPRRFKVLSRLRRKNFQISEDAMRFEDLIRNRPLEWRESLDPRRDLAVIQYTSGTTGPPKGAMLTHFSLVANVLQTFHWLRGWGYSRKPQPAGWPVVVCAVPFFHIYGMTVALNESVHFGSTLVLVPDPKPLAIMRAIDRFEATHFPAISPMIRGIVEHPEVGRFNLRSLTSCVSGGAAIDPELVKRFIEITGATFYQGYGLTEAGPVTHCTTVDDDAPARSSGLAFPDTEAKVVDLQLGEIEVPRGEEGELIVRGPQLMAGYWGDPESTSEALRNGWLYTGDIARIDAAGRLFVVDRKQDQIFVSGHTVWPSQVEEVLSTHPYVGSVAVLGVPDPLRCATDLRAYVVLKGVSDEEKAKRELMKYCEERLEAYQVPSEIKVMRALPLTSLGKVDRRALRELENKA